jgi:hypothetical protein
MLQELGSTPSIRGWIVTLPDRDVAGKKAFSIKSTVG